MITDTESSRPSRALSWGMSAGTLLITGLIVWAVLGLPEDAPGLRQEVEARLAESAVASQVTAVLLNFRAYDTFLEIAVLLVAVLGMQAIRLGSREPLVEPGEVSPLLMEFVRFFTPVMLLLAGYLLWAGSHAPGGAFQAGAVLGAAGILLQVAERLRVGALSPWVERWVLAIGVIGFGAVGALCVLWGGAFLEYPREHAKTLIVSIEALSALSIGAILAVLFAGRSLAEAQDAAVESGEHGP